MSFNINFFLFNKVNKKDKSKGYIEVNEILWAEKFHEKFLKNTFVLWISSIILPITMWIIIIKTTSMV